MSNSDAEAKRLIVYYTMAYKFGFKPEEVDRMDNRMLAAFMHITEQVGEDMDDRMSRRMQ